MRIAVISDIHANRYALKAFIQWLDEQKDVEAVWNAGDFINVGPHPREVAEIVLDDSRFVNILGNNEEAILAGLDPTAGNNRHRLWTASRLHAPLLERIRQLPRKHLVELLNQRILMVHSRPEDASDLPLLYQKRSLREFSADYNAEEPQVVIFGHTHEPAYLRHNERHFINPGSLGLGRGGRGTFAVLTVTEIGISVEFRVIPWDNAALAADFIKRDVPDKEFLMERFFSTHTVQRW